jgi:hypothetical protein
MFYNLIKKYFGDSTNIFHQFELIELKLLMNKIALQIIYDKKYIDWVSDCCLLTS